jgi:hypothetical protein
MYTQKANYFVAYRELQNYTIAFPGLCTWLCLSLKMVYLLVRRVADNVLETHTLLRDCGPANTTTQLAALLEHRWTRAVSEQNVRVSENESASILRSTILGFRSDVR